MDTIQIIDMTINDKIIYRPAAWWKTKAERIGIKHYKKGYFLNVKDYDIFQLLYVISGEMTFKTPEVTEVLYPGRIVILRLGSDYTASTLEGSCDVLSLTIQGDHSKDFIGESEVISADRTTRQLVEIIINSLDYRKAINLKLLRLLADAFLTQVTFLAEPSNMKVSSQAYSEHFVKRARELIDSSLRSGKNIREILAGVGLSYRQISRYFSEAFGMSPKQYQLKARMQEARDMLLNDPRTISLIAFELGYSSAQHLSKQFKEYHGFSPKDYRENR